MVNRDDLAAHGYAKGEGIDAVVIGLLEKHRVCGKRERREVEQYLHIALEKLISEADRLYQQGQRQQSLRLHEVSLDGIRTLWKNSPLEAQTLNNIGMTLFSLGRFEEALSYLQQSLRIGREINNPSAEGVATHNIGEVYYKQNLLEKAMKQFTQALPILRKVGNRYFQAKAHLCIGTIHLTWEQLEKSQDHCRQTLMIAREMGNKTLEAQARHLFGLIYYNQKNLAAALECFEDVIQNLPYHILTLLGKCTTLEGLSRRDEAIACFHDVLQQNPDNQEAQDALARLTPDDEITPLLSRGYNLIKQHQESSSKGRSKLFKQLQLFALELTLAGENQLALVHFNNVFPLFELLLKLGKTFNDPMLTSCGYMSLASVDFVLEQYEAVLENCQHALVIFRKQGDRSNEALALQAIGLAYKGLGRYHESEDHLKQALLIYQELGERDGESSVLKELSDVQRVLGKPKDAVESSRQASLIQHIAEMQLIEKTLSRFIAAWIVNPKDVENLLDLAKAREKLGHDDQAISAYRLILKVDQDNKQSLEGLKRLGADA